MDKKKVKSTPKSDDNKASKQIQRQIQLAVAALLLLLVALFPKPQLITYEYASMVSEGVYWDGLFGPGVLFDSNAKFVSLDEDTEHLHVCFNKENDNCLRYKVIENEGFGGYLASLLN